MSRGKPKSFKKFAKKLPEEIKRRRRAQKYKNRVAERQHKKERRIAEEEKERAQTEAADREFDEKANKDEAEAIRMVSGKMTFEDLVAKIPLDTPIEGKEANTPEEIPFTTEEVKEAASLLLLRTTPKKSSSSTTTTTEEEEETVSAEDMLKVAESASQARKVCEYAELLKLTKATIKTLSSSPSATNVATVATVVVVSKDTVEAIGERAATSLGALKLLVELFRLACRYDEAVSPRDTTIAGIDCSFSSGAAVEATLSYGLTHAGDFFEGHLGIPADLSGEERQKRVVQLLRSRSKVWNSGIALLSRTFLRAAVGVLGRKAEAGGPALRTRLVSALYRYVPFFAQFPLVANLYTDVLAQFITECAEGDLARKAFSTILAVAQACVAASTFTADALRLLYRRYVTASAAPDLRDPRALCYARRCAADLCGLNYTAAYKAFFPYVRMLGLYVRGAVLAAEDRDCGALVRSWPVVDAARMWAAVLAVHAPVSDHLKNFILPVVQTLFNIIDFCPDAAQVALRIACVDAINDLSFKTQTFSNTLPALLQCLAHKELKRDLPRDTASSGIDVNSERYAADGGAVLHISKQRFLSRALQKDIFERIYSGMVEFLAHYSYSIAFPEIAVPALVALRKYKLECMNLFFCKRVAFLIAKIKANYDWVIARRNRVDFTPKDIDAAKDFLKGEKAKSPLGAEWSKIAKKQASVLGEVSDSDDDDPAEEEEMIEESGSEVEGFDDEFDEENEDAEDDMMIMNDEFDEDVDDDSSEEDERRPPKRKRTKRN